MSSSAPTPPAVSRLVVRLPSWVGDAVMATPALRALRERYPRAEIALQGRGHLEPLLAGSGLFDRFIPVERGSGSTRRNSAALREWKPELAIILPHSFRAAFEVFRAGIPRRLGYEREGRGWLLTESLTPHIRSGRRSPGKWLRGAAIGLADRVSKKWIVRAAESHPTLLRERRELEPIIPVPMVAQYLELVAVLGAKSDGLGPRLGIPDDVASGADEDLAAIDIAPDAEFVAVNPGASFGESKVYPMDLLADALDRLHEDTGLPTVILCGPGEEPLAESLAEAMASPAHSTSRRMLGLDRVKRAIQRARVMVTTDTGPWHVANAVETPSVVLMGPTDPRYTAAFLERSIVLRHEVPCGPCHLKQCPLGHACMRGISPARVVESALRVMPR
ncbi:MAG: glycosyltransferase family 9 protein [Planctomycetota bacterium]